MLPVLVFNKDEQWVAHLVEMQSTAKWNKGTQYLLTVVDVLSKFACVRPLKNKTGEAVVRAFKNILKTSGRKPQRLQTDKCEEFYNTKVQTWLKDEGIQHFPTYGDAKASVVDRFNRTLKGRMYRYFKAANTLTYLDVLPASVKAYNSDVHRSIGMAPRRDGEQRSTRVADLVRQTVWKEDTYTQVEGACDGPVAQWLRFLPTKQKIPGSNPGSVVTILFSYLGRESSSVEQEGMNVQERVFATMDGRSVCGVARGARSSDYLRVKKMDGTPLQGTFYEQDMQKVTLDEKT